MIDSLFFFWRQQSWLRNALFMALVGMEISWLAPLAISLNRRSWQVPTLEFMLAMGVMLLFMMLVANYLSMRQIDSPLFELAVLAVIVFTALLVLRLYIFWGEPFFSWRWLGVFFAADDPRRIEAFWVVGVMAYLWWRGVTFLQRDVGFFVIGLDFRKGMLGLIAGVVLFSKLVGRSPVAFIYAFFFFSLLAVALGRIEDKMRARGDAGPDLQPVWLPLLVVASLGVLLLAAGLHQLWSLNSFAWLGHALAPVSSRLLAVVEPVMLFLLSLLEPVFQWLIHFIQSRMGPDAATDPLITMPPSTAELFGQEGGRLPDSQLPMWFVVLFRYILPALLIIVVLTVLILWLDRHRKSRRTPAGGEERETLPGDERRGLGDILQQGWQRLRGWADLMGRYGLGRRFYAAVSVRYLYANLQHLAARRGYPRARSQTPNDYLSSLQRAFPGLEPDLQQLTDAYNAVEYGHVSTDEDELAALRHAWERIERAARESPPQASP